MTFPGFAEAVRGMAPRSFYVLSLLCACSVSADQVDMSNGDRYVGRVLSLSGETLVLQSEVLGNLRLPRSRISTILLEPRAAVSGTSTNLTRFALAAPRSKFALGSNNVARAAGGTSTNASAEFSAAMQQLGANSNMLHQVQEQFLSGAGPEAQAKFNDLMGGLLSGKVDLTGLRAEAKSTLDQAKKARGDMGEEGGMIDSYLAILDSFLKETEPEAAVTNTAPATALKVPAKKPSQEE